LKHSILTAEGEAVGAIGEALVGAPRRALDEAGGAPVCAAGDLVVAVVEPARGDGDVLGARRQLLGVSRRGLPG
jgi:hypothetical protein